MVELLFQRTFSPHMLALALLAASVRGRGLVMQAERACPADPAFCAIISNSAPATFVGSKGIINEPISIHDLLVFPF